MTTHLIVFNRAAVATSAGWIHIVPKGELPNREAGIVQVLDDTSLDSILRNIHADQQRLGDKWPGIYAGREHFIYNDDQDSAALAWFKEFEKRPDGIWAKDDGLTDIGRDVLRNGHYKFTSFVADRRDTQKLGANHFRILKLDTIGFTNNANGKELLTPITNRTSHLEFRNPGTAHLSHQHLNLTEKNARPTAVPSPGGEGQGEGELKISNTNQSLIPTKMKNLLTAMGLSADSSEDTALAHFAQLMNRLGSAEESLAPLKDRTTELETQNSQLIADQVDNLFAVHGVRDEKIRNRLKPVLVAMKNRDERINALTDFGFKPVDLKENRSTRVLNRAEANPTQSSSFTNSNDQELAAKAGAEITDYQVRNRCTYAEARNIIRTRKPELFGLTK